MIPDLRPEVYGREMRALCMTPYDGPDPLGLGPSVCLIPDDELGKHAGRHTDRHGREWWTKVQPVVVTQDTVDNYMRNALLDFYSRTGRDDDHRWHQDRRQ